VPAPGVKARVERLWRAIRRLKTISEVGEERFIDNEDLIDAAERNLQVAVEATIDVGEALIAYMRWRTPRSYREVGAILLEQGVIDETLYRLFQEAVSIRNVLVPNYVHMTSKELYANIRSLVVPLARIMNSILSYMQEKNIDP